MSVDGSNFILGSTKCPFRYSHYRQTAIASSVNRGQFYDLLYDELSKSTFTICCMIGSVHQTHAQVRDTQLLLTHLNWFGIEVVVNLSIGGSGGGGGEVLAGDSRTRGRLYKHPLIIKAKQE